MDVKKVGVFSPSGRKNYHRKQKGKMQSLVAKMRHSTTLTQPRIPAARNRAKPVRWRSRRRSTSPGYLARKRPST